MLPLEVKQVKNMCSKTENQRRTNLVANWEVEKKLKKSMVETIQQMQVVSSPFDLLTPLVGEWTTSWVGMPSSTKLAERTKFQEIPSTFPSKIVFVEEIFRI